MRECQQMALTEMALTLLPHIKVLDSNLVADWLVGLQYEYCITEYILLSTGSQGGKGFVQALQESPARYPFCLSASVRGMGDSHVPRTIT